MVHESLTLEALSALEPREAAAYLIARRAEGLSVSQQQLLAGWLAKDEVHRRMFEYADRAWQCFAEPGGDEVLEAMRKHALGARSRTYAARWPAAMAAAVVLSVCAAVLLIPSFNTWIHRSQPQGTTSVASIEYASARGDVKDISLPDGSNMTLDAESTAIGRFSSNSRKIELIRGRALFAVRPDRSRPFTVAAGGRSIIAVGTRFDVNLVGETLSVTLLEGRLELASADPARAHLTLEPGQQYIQRDGKETIRTIGAASENEIGWRVGLVAFDNQPLDEAVAVMNRYSHDQIVIGDSSVASIKVSGQFRAGDAHRFASTLAEMHKLRAVARAGQIELLPQE
jgi:transmembrane sensor